MVRAMQESSYGQQPMKVKPFSRPAMGISFDVFAGTVRSIDIEDDKRVVCVVDGCRRMTLMVKNDRVRVTVGHSVILAHYKADGFLPKLAGIHNCSSGAWYLMRQPDEYLDDWLRVYRVQTWHYLLLMTLLIGAIITTVLFPVPGLCLFLSLIIGLKIIIGKLKKSRLMLGNVTCKSLAVQLMAEFRDLADTDEG